MCLSPVSIINPTKYISLRYRDQYLLEVPCGHCAECQQTMSRQWQYRTYYEFQDCLAHDGYIMFDTLTYNNDYLPCLSDFMMIDKKHDYYCFNGKHLKDFFKRLRIQVKRLGYSVEFRYFVSSEYGTSDSYEKNGLVRRSTHRPHYHLLLFVRGDVPYDVLSSSISKAWVYGRTDGCPYKSKKYVLEHNMIKETSLEAILRTSNYVTKYVQKSCVFQKELDRRIGKVMQYYANQMLISIDDDKWIESFEAQQLRLSLKRVVNQFHRQSLHFGEIALRDMDIDEVMERGYLIMPNFKSIKIKICLPTYYKRKLFYRLLEIDGCKTWQLNELGFEYKKKREANLIAELKKKFDDVCRLKNLHYDTERLANYVYDKRGRIKADLPSCKIEERLEHVDLFNYVTAIDKKSLGSRGLSIIYLGNKSNYYDGHFDKSVAFNYTIRDFIARYVMLDDEREKELSTIYYYLSILDSHKQEVYELKQILVNKYKVFLAV